MNQLEIEQTVLGMILDRPACISEAYALDIKPGHFVTPAYGRAYDAALNAWSAGRSIDLFTLCQEIGQEHRMALINLKASAPPTQNFAPYAQALIDLRRTLELQERLATFSRRLAHRRVLDPLEPIIEELSLLLVGASETAAMRAVPYGQALEESIAVMEKKLEGPRGIKTGIAGLDREIYGWQPGFVYVLGARTGIGKTTLATNFAVTAAKAGERTAYFTVEMGASDIADKTLAEAARVNLTRILSGNLDAADIDSISTQVSTLATLPLEIIEVDKPELHRLEAKMTRQVRVKKTKLLVIDYLQQFEINDDAFKQRREDTKIISGRMKQLARSLKVPVVILSQLNRLTPEHAQPSLVHLADSDRVGRDADVVLMLWQDEQEAYSLTIAKNRRGRCGTIPLNAELHFSRFRERT